MTQNKENKAPQSQDLSFTVDAEKTGVGGMPSVSRLLDRKKLESSSKQTPQAPLPPSTTRSAPAPALDVPSYAPAPPGGELDLGLSLEANAAAESLLELRPEAVKTEVDPVAPAHDGMGQLELNAEEIAPAGIELSPSLELASAPTEPAVPAVTPHDATTTSPTTVASKDDLPFDLPAPIEGAATPSLETQQTAFAPPPGETAAHIEASGPRSDIRVATRRRGPDLGMAAEYRESSFLDLLTKNDSFTQALGVLFEAGASSALVLQDGGGEVVAALGVDAAHRGPVWRGLRWNPSFGGDIWSQLLKAQAYEVAPQAKLPEGAPTPVVTHIRSGFRAGLGVDATETLSLFQLDLPEFGKGVLAVVSPASIQATFAAVKPLLKNAGSLASAA